MAEHGDEPDVALLCSRLAEQSEQHASLLARFSETYLVSGLATATDAEIQRFGGARPGTLDLLLDLLDLDVLANEVDTTWPLVAHGLRDESLLKVVNLCEGETVMQVKFRLPLLKIHPSPLIEQCRRVRRSRR